MTSSPYFARVFWGAVVAGVAAVILALVLHNSHPYVVWAEFKDASYLKKNSQVKIGGVPAGTIERVKLTKNDTALLRLELKKNAAPIGAGATAAARPSNLLGEKYIDLNPGDRAHPLPSGTEIPLARTSTPVELDQVLDMLDPDTRARLRIQIQEAGISMAGRGADFNKMLAELPPSLDKTTQLLEDMKADNRTLGRLVDEGDHVLASFAGHRDDVGDLVDSATRAVAVTASRRAQLGATVRAAPGALRQLTGSLTKLQTTSEDLRPAVADLSASAAPLARTLDELPGFASAAHETLSAARSAAPKLTTLAVGAGPPLRQLAPSLRLLRRTTSTADPLVDSLDNYGMQDLLYFLATWARVVKSSDGLGHLFGAHLTVDEDPIRQYLDRFKGDPLKHRQGAARKPAGLPEAVRPLVHKPAPVHLPQRLKDVTKKVADALPKAVGDAVGSIQQGVGGAVKQILQGGDSGAPKLPLGGGRREDSDVSALLDYLLAP